MVADSTKTLNLKQQNLRNLKFINKSLQGNNELRILDLTDSHMGNRGAIEISSLIETTKTIEVLNLSKNRIGTQGLQHLCSALTVNRSIKHIDLTENMIPDDSLKIILAMLFRNLTIEDIAFSVTLEKNVQRIEKFNAIKHLAIEDIEDKLEKFQEHKDLTRLQKLCLPLWCWKSFIRDKHEAFRFKYDTMALNTLEEELMDWMTVAVYFNSLIYYIIMFVAPFFFVNECGEGLSNISHYIYGVYSFFTIIFEIYIVLKIQKKLDNKNLLKFNKWHFVELLMGQVAHFDTYLDVCFLSLLLQCREWNLVIPVWIFVFVFLTYPFYKMFRLLRI